MKERLISLNQEFNAELEKSTKKELQFEELEAARERGNLFVRQVVAVTLGSHYQETEEAAEKREKLLNPILDQCERVRQARKGRRKAQDIDPETGEELVEETEAA